MYFVLKFCIQVSRILFFSNLFEQKLFKCSDDPTRCGIVRNHRTTAFSRLIRTTLWQPPFFPSVHYANQLPLMSQYSQSDIAPSSLCLIPSWIYKKRSIFCDPHQLTSQRSVFLQFCAQIQSRMHQIFTQLHSKISIGPSHMYTISACPKQTLSAPGQHHPPTNN